jgi:hypothetical protein
MQAVQYMIAPRGAAPLRLEPPVTLLRRQIRQSHSNLDDSAAVWLQTTPSPSLWSSPLRLYLHALLVEDITVQSVLLENAPLFSWLCPGLGGPGGVAELRQYARAVYGSTDAYLARMSADGLNGVLDLDRLGVGRRTVEWVIRRFVITEVGCITRSISETNRPTSVSNSRHSPTDPGRRSLRNSGQRAKHHGHPR